MLPQKLSPEERRKKYNHLYQVLTSPEFIDFVNKKLRSESGLDLNQIENPNKIFGNKLLPWLKEYFEAKSTPYLDKPYSEQMENPDALYVKQLLVYFEKLSKVRDEKISRLSTEDVYTLKQFLKDKYLSATDVEKILKGTDFEVAYNHVNDRVHKLHNLDLLKETEPTGYAFISEFNSRNQYYKLTSCGLFFALKEIQEEDVGHQFVIESTLGSRIFEIYKDDPFFQIFLYDVIDENLLFKITDNDIKWTFIGYLNQICQEIYKALEVFVEYQAKGLSGEFEVKWNHDLTNKKEQLSRFFDKLLLYIVRLDDVDYTVPHLIDLIDNPRISKNSCSFYYHDQKYSIDIDRENKKAIFRIDGEEYFKVYDSEKGKEVNRKHGEIGVHLKKHCFVLRSFSQESYAYLIYLSFSFFDSIRTLRTKLGYSVLQLFKEDILAGSEQSLTPDSKKYLDELRKIASDEKVKKLINDFYKEANKNYNGFTKYAK